MDRRQYRLYLGTRPGAIHAYNLDAKTGDVSAIGPAVENDGAGSFIAVSADGKFLYAAAKAAAVAFKIEQTGALSHINSVTSDVSGNSHICLAGKGAFLAVLAAYQDGGINVAEIQRDGSLVKPDRSSVVHQGGSGVFPHDADAQSVAHPHSAFADPSGQRILVSDLGQDKVYVYSVASGNLEEESVLSTAAGSGPRHLCFHPKGRWVYGINELDCSINVYAYDTAGGKLGEILQTLSTLPDGYNNHEHANAKNAEGKPASGPNRGSQTNATADIHISPDGRFVYGSNRGHDSIACYSVGRDGLLTVSGFTSTKGEHPRAFSIHPSGNWLLVANQDSNNVVIFKVEKKTGALTETGQILDTKQPRCIQWAVAPPALKKPSWTTVDKINPDSKGVNVFVKVVKSIQGEATASESEVIVGDSTAVVTLRAQGPQMALCEVGNILRIQNARAIMVKGFIRLDVNKWGVLALAPSGHENIELTTSKDISAVEYELS